jgi:hypothetical protein
LATIEQKVVLMSSIIAAGQGQLGVQIENGIGTIRVYSETRMTLARLRLR